MEEDIDIDFLNTYTKIKQDKLQYCNICLKNEKETKLVKSRGLRLLFKGLKNQKIEMSPSALICCMCDARAATAAAFISALEFACEVKVLFAAMNTNSMLQDHFRSYSGKQVKFFKDSLLKTYLRCESNFKIVRRRSTLSQSKVLLVGTGSNTQSEKTNKEAKKPAGISQPEIVISDDEDDDVVSVPTITPKPIEKLIDKHTTIPKIPQKTPTISPPKAPELQIEVNRSENTNTNLIVNPQSTLNNFSIILPQNLNATVVHPIYQDSSGSILIPTLGGLIDKQGNFKPLQKVTVEPANLLAPNQSHFIIENDLLPKPQTSNKTPPLMVINSVKSVASENPENVGKSLQTRDADWASNRSHCIIENDLLPNPQSSNDTPPSLVVNSGKVESVENPENVGKRKSSQTRDVDWEDRIPMDVITVMENSAQGTENDNTSTAKRPRTICAIENVRSVK